MIRLSSPKNPVAISAGLASAILVMAVASSAYGAHGGSSGPRQFAKLPSTNCTLTPPAEFGDRPSRWLGDCIRGKAEGVGVMRFGASAPFSFFAGIVRAGRPIRGMLIDDNGMFRVAWNFDQRANAIDAGGDRPSEQDQVFKIAAQAAEATSKRFSARGNRGSASYYGALAKRIREGKPE